MARKKPCERRFSTTFGEKWTAFCRKSTAFARKSTTFAAEESEAAKEKIFSRGRFGIVRSNAYICGLNHSSMQQLLRYLFSLLCVVALSSVGALRAADVVAAAPSSESPAFVAPSEVSISLRGNQLRVTNADGQTVEVYNITGVKVFVHRVEGDDRTFTLSAERGIYIVKVGKVVRRVTLL